MDLAVLPMALAVGALAGARTAASLRRDPGSAVILRTGGLGVIRKEAWPFSQNNFRFPPMLGARRT